MAMAVFNLFCARDADAAIVVVVAAPTSAKTAAVLERLPRPNASPTTAPPTINPVCAPNSFPVVKF